VKEEKNLPHVFKDIPYQLIPFPKLSAPVNHKPTYSMGDVLIRRGFADESLLKKQFKKWQAIYRAIDPDMVVYDFSPTALFSSAGFNFKKVIVESTWGAAPPGRPFLPLNLWQSMPEDHISISEKNLLGVMNSVLETSSYSALDNASDIFKADLTLISNFKEFDIYGAERIDANYLGPIFFNTKGEEIELGSEKKRMFVYVKEDRKVTKLAIAALDKISQSEVHIFIPNVSDSLKVSLERRGFSVYSKPIALQRYIGRFDVVLCHGGAGTVGMSVRSGVPVVIFPTQLEQKNVGELVSRSGAGLVVDPNEPEGSAQLKIESILVDERYKRNCKEIRKSVPATNSVNTQIRALLQPLCG
jgi:hypothetical protein